jgi:hypothetical protein
MSKDTLGEHKTTKPLITKEIYEELEAQKSGLIFLSQRFEKNSKFGLSAQVLSESVDGVCRFCKFSFSTGFRTVTMLILKESEDSFNVQYEDSDGELQGNITLEGECVKSLPEYMSNFYNQVSHIYSYHLAILGI